MAASQLLSAAFPVDIIQQAVCCLPDEMTDLIYNTDKYKIINSIYTNKIFLKP